MSCFVTEMSAIQEMVINDLDTWCGHLVIVWTVWWGCVYTWALWNKMECHWYNAIQKYCTLDYEHIRHKPSFAKDFMG